MLGDGNMSKGLKLQVIGNRKRKQEKRKEKVRNRQRVNAHKRRHDPLGGYADILVKYVETQMFGIWIREQLGKIYPGAHTTEEMVDASDKDGYSVEMEEHFAEISQFPVQHYMLINPDGVVIAGMQITVENVLDELGKLSEQQKAKITNDKDDSQPE